MTLTPSYDPAASEATSCTISVQTLDGSSTPYGAPVDAPFAKGVCCAYFLEGSTTDVSIRAACDTTYDTYAFAASVCTANLVPVNPGSVIIAISPIATGETRPNSECC